MKDHSLFLILLTYFGTFLKHVSAQQPVSFPEPAAVGVNAPPTVVSLTSSRRGGIDLITVLTAGSTAVAFSGAGTCTVRTTYLAGQQRVVLVGSTPTEPGQQLEAGRLLENRKSSLATQTLEPTRTSSIALFVAGIGSVTRLAPSQLTVTQ